MTWLRISYWVGAVIDFVVAIAMIFPQLSGLAFGFSSSTPDPPYRYAMGMGASLMLGWTVLLIWADQDPLERKGVLLITIFPVILGIAATVLQSYAMGWISLENALMTWLMQSVLIGMLLYSYIQAFRYQRDNQSTS